MTAPRKPRDRQRPLKARPKLRLVNVAVQANFVLDDGKELVPVPPQQVVISANEWPTYSSERFPAEVAAWQKQVDREGPSLPPPSPSPPRRTRRAAKRTKR